MLFTLTETKTTVQLLLVIVLVLFNRPVKEKIIYFLWFISFIFLICFSLFYSFYCSMYYGLKSDLLSLNFVVNRFL